MTASLTPGGHAVRESSGRGFGEGEEEIERSCAVVFEAPPGLRDCSVGLLLPGLRP